MSNENKQMPIDVSNNEVEPKTENPTKSSTPMMQDPSQTPVAPAKPVVPAKPTTPAKPTIPEVRQIPVKKRPLIPPVKSEAKPNPVTPDPESNWEFYKYGVYLKPKKRKLPAWFLPLLIFIVIVASIFVALPKLAERQDKKTNSTQIGVVNDGIRYQIRASVAPVYASPDLRSERLTEALLAEEVVVLETLSDKGFYKVRLTDGIEGYVVAKQVASNEATKQSKRVLMKLLVLDSEKNIVSAASGGTLIQKAYMGTILELDYIAKGLGRIILPDGGEGWISTEGTSVVEPQATFGTSGDLTEYFTNTVLTFENAKFVPSGLTRSGASPQGIAYVAARINGVNLPRQVESLMAIGAEVEKPALPLKNIAGLAGLQQGDLLFFETYNPITPYQVGIYLGGGRVLTTLTNETTLDTVDLMLHPELAIKLHTVRRFIDAS